MPKDNALRDQLLEKSSTKNKYEFLGFYDAMWRSIWISIIFGFSFFLFAYFQPYIAVPWVIFAGGIISTIFGILILV
jgi:LPS O-antigen subunit length determinant protein (WzzB/FepE family)